MTAPSNPPWMIGTNGRYCSYRVLRMPWGIRWRILCGCEVDMYVAYTLKAPGPDTDVSIGRLAFVPAKKGLMRQFMRTCGVENIPEGVD